eukprot:TRINITY_DN141_c0_g2_i1.p1 TRINITY_DN141_c0_g2~~TRINITY_DN141_c0_g2_i1.p1  ORF type:complete len:2352 (+),score=395.74 TRINITY_DN141_c0_g2_i1:67-7122(+)
MDEPPGPNKLKVLLDTITECRNEPASVTVKVLKDLCASFDKDKEQDALLAIGSSVEMISTHTRSSCLSELQHYEEDTEKLRIISKLFESSSSTFKSQPLQRTIEDILKEVVAKVSSDTPCTPYLVYQLFRLHERSESLRVPINRIFNKLHAPCCQKVIKPFWHIDLCDIKYETYQSGRKAGQWVRLGRGVAADLLAVKVFGKNYVEKEWKSDAGRISMTEKVFVREMKILHSALHQNVIQIIGGCIAVDDSECTISIISERVASTLDNLLFLDDPISLLRLSNIFTDAALGMLYLHKSFSLPHQNLKPSNIGITDTNVVKILDYRSTPINQSVLSGQLMTSQWAAPELDGEITRATLQSDVWSWGAVFLSGITQESPSNGSDVVPQKTVSGDVVSDSLRDLLEKTLSPCAASRPSFSEIYDSITKGTTSGDQAHQVNDPNSKSLQTKLKSLPLPQERYVSVNSIRGNPESWETIGEGSFGRVYKTVYEPIQDYVAIKELRSDCMETQLSFHKEITNLNNIRVNQVLNFYGWTTSGNRVYMITEYCERGHLKGVLEEERSRNELGPLEWGMMCLNVGLTISQSLTFIHSKGFVHLDIAARNVLVTAWGQYKLSDLGIMTPENDPAPVISLPWSPPEALRAKSEERQAVFQHDIWSLSVLLYEVLNKGPAPFEDLRVHTKDDRSWLHELVAAVVRGDKPPPPVTAAQCPVCTDIWETIILPCRSMAPGKRLDLKQIIGRIAELKESQASSTPDRKVVHQSNLQVDVDVYGGGPNTAVVGGVYGCDAPLSECDMDGVVSGLLQPPSSPSSLGRSTSDVLHAMNTTNSLVSPTLTLGGFVENAPPAPPVRKQFSDGTDSISSNLRAEPHEPLNQARLQGWGRQSFWDICHDWENWVNENGKIWPSHIVHAALHNAEVIQKKNTPHNSLLHPNNTNVFLPIYMYSSEFYAGTTWVWWDGDSWQILPTSSELEDAASTLRKRGGSAEVQIPIDIKMYLESREEAEGIESNIFDTKTSIWLVPPTDETEGKCGITRFDMSSVQLMRYENLQRGNPALSPLYDSVLWAVPPTDRISPPPSGILEYIWSRPPSEDLSGSSLYRFPDGKEGELVINCPPNDPPLVRLYNSCEERPVTSSTKAVETFPNTKTHWVCKPSLIPDSIMEKLSSLLLNDYSVSLRSQQGLADEINTFLKGDENAKVRAMVLAKLRHKKLATAPIWQVLHALTLQELVVSDGDTSQTYLLSLSGSPFLVGHITDGVLMAISGVQRLCNAAQTHPAQHINNAIRRAHERKTIHGTAQAVVSGIQGIFYQLPTEQSQPVSFYNDEHDATLHKVASTHQWKMKSPEAPTEEIISNDRVTVDWCTSPTQSLATAVKVVQSAMSSLPNITQPTNLKTLIRCTDNTEDFSYNSHSVVVWPAFSLCSVTPDAVRGAKTTVEISFSRSSDSCHCVKNATGLTRFSRESEYILPEGIPLWVTKSTDKRVDLQLLSSAEAGKMVVRTSLLELPTGGLWAERIAFKVLQALDTDGRVDLSLKHPREGITPDRWQYWIEADDEVETPLPPSHEWTNIEDDHIIESWLKSDDYDLTDSEEDLCAILAPDGGQDLQQYLTFMTEIVLTNNTSSGILTIDITGLDYGADGSRLRVSLRKRRGRGSLAIGTEGALFLASLIEKRIPITRLAIQHNDIGQQGANAILESLRSNNNIVEVNLMNSEIERIPFDVSEAIKLRTLANWFPTKILDYIWDVRPSIVGRALWDISLWECDLSNIAEQGQSHARELVSIWVESRQIFGAIPIPTDRHGGSYLHLAAASDWCGTTPWGDRDVTMASKAVSIITKFTPDINCTDSKGMTPLHYAAMNLSGSAQHIITLLLVSGASVLAKDHMSNTPLHRSARTGTPESLIQLLEDGVDVIPAISATNQFGSTALTALSTNARFNTPRGRSAAELYIRMGGSLGVSDKDGKTALHHAAGFGYAELLLCLSELGADPNVKDNAGKSVLLLAASNKKLNTESGAAAVASLITKGGADTTERCATELPVVAALRAGADLLVSVILKATAENFEYTETETLFLLSRSTRHSNCDIVKAILSLPTSHQYLQAKDDRGVTVLHRAARNPHLESSDGLQILPTLCKEITDIDCVNESGRTPLWYAANAGHTQLAGYFISRGSDVSKQDRIGNSPLHEATSHPTCLLAILKDANPGQLQAALNSVSVRGHTPLRLAVTNDYCWMAEDGRSAIQKMLAKNPGSASEVLTHFVAKITDSKLRESLPEDEVRSTLDIIRSTLDPTSLPADLAPVCELGLEGVLTNWKRQSLPFEMKTKKTDEVIYNDPADSFQRHRTPWDTETTEQCDPQSFGKEDTGNTGTA